MRLAFQVWGGDSTPSVDCAYCGDELLAWPNGNAPLDFTLPELLWAAAKHHCRPKS